MKSVLGFRQRYRDGEWMYGMICAPFHVWEVYRGLPHMNLSIDRSINRSIAGEEGRGGEREGRERERA